MTSYFDDPAPQRAVPGRVGEVTYNSAGEAYVWTGAGYDRAPALDNAREAAGYRGGSDSTSRSHSTSSSTSYNTSQSLQDPRALDLEARRISLDEVQAQRQYDLAVQTGNREAEQFALQRLDALEARKQDLELSYKQLEQTGRIRAEDRAFQGGESALDRAARASEAAAGRGFQAGESALDRAARLQEGGASRAFQAGESALDRAARASEFAATHGLNTARFGLEQQDRKMAAARQLSDVISSTDPAAIAAFAAGGGGVLANAIARGGSALSNNALLPAARTMRAIDDMNRPAPQAFQLEDKGPVEYIPMGGRMFSDISALSPEGRQGIYNSIASNQAADLNDRAATGANLDPIRQQYANELDRYKTETETRIANGGFALGTGGRDRVQRQALPVDPWWDGYRAGQAGQQFVGGDERFRTGYDSGMRRTQTARAADRGGRAGRFDDSGDLYEAPAGFALGAPSIPAPRGVFDVGELEPERMRVTDPPGANNARIAVEPGPIGRTIRYYLGTRRPGYAFGTFEDPMGQGLATAEDQGYLDRVRALRQGVDTRPPVDGGYFNVGFGLQAPTIQQRYFRGLQAKYGGNAGDFAAEADRFRMAGAGQGVFRLGY